MVSAQATGLLKMSFLVYLLPCLEWLMPAYLLLLKSVNTRFSPDRPTFTPTSVQPGPLGPSSIQDISLPKLSVEQLTPLLDSQRAGPGSNFSQGSQDPVQGKQHLGLAGPDLHGCDYLPALLLCAADHSFHLTGVGHSWIGVVFPVGAPVGIWERCLWGVTVPRHPGWGASTDLSPT